MPAAFRGRTEARRRLARRLEAGTSRSEVLVLALPRGEVALGYELARALRATLDFFNMRKYGVSSHEKLAREAARRGV